MVLVGTLKPLFVIEPREKDFRNDGDKFKRNANVSRDQNSNFIRSPRGRSFSPPKRQKETISSDERERFINVQNDRKSKRRFINTPHFRKSFSSEQLSCTEKLPQPHFLSSGSSISSGNLKIYSVN